jgi:hypothetical protein
MSRSLRTFTHVLGAAAGAALFAATLAAQGSPGVKPSEQNFFIETPAGWVQPKTPWGDPDIQGMWPISYVGSVPLERCAGGFARGRGGAPPCDLNKAFLTEEEYKERLKAAGLPDRATQALASGNYGAALLSGVTDPTFPQRQTSLIVDPPNGKLPELTEEGKRASAKMKSSWALPGEKQTWDAPEDFDTWDRCITRGMPASMFPYRYNNGLRIMQVPGYVVLDLEMIHESRIVPLDGRPHISPKIEQYLGDSRGHWDGNTLVIETTNLKPGASVTNIGVMGSPAGNRMPASNKMKITEKIRRINNDFLIYEITTDDPVMMTRPWTARFPLRLDNSYDWWEYACHEGNTAIRNYITTSRAERAKEAAAEKK